jgi:hypothetical protein
MSSINLIDEKLPDITAIRLIYTQKMEHKKGDTIAIHLKRKDLNDLIDEIDKIQKKDPKKTGYGIRFYISKYPAGYAHVRQQDYSKKHSVVAVATYGDDTNHFDDMDAELVKKLVTKIKKGDPDPVKQGGSDHYELCPPNTGCANGMIIWNNIQ